MKTDFKDMMVFIDAENISYKYIDKIYNLTNSYNMNTEIRYYSRQKGTNTKSWIKNNRHKFKAILLYGKSDKNKVDKKIIKDIRKLQNNSMISHICLVSNDGDYASILNETKDKGKNIIVLSTRQVSYKLIRICDEYKCMQK